MQLLRNFEKIIYWCPFVYQWCCFTMHVIDSVIFSARKRSCGKVMFSQVSVCLSTGGISSCCSTAFPQFHEACGSIQRRAASTGGGCIQGGAFIGGGEHSSGFHLRCTTPEDRQSKGGWYASYWNAYLFTLCSHQFNIRSIIQHIVDIFPGIHFQLRGWLTLKNGMMSNSTKWFKNTGSHVTPKIHETILTPTLLGWTRNGRWILTAHSPVSPWWARRKICQTRMHSSRMHNARDRDPNGQRPQWTATPWTETPLERESLDRDPQIDNPQDRDPLERDLPGKRPPLDRDPPGQRLPWRETLLDRVPPWIETPWTETPLDRVPPDRQPPGQRPPGERPPWKETPPDRVYISTKYFFPLVIIIY